MEPIDTPPGAASQPPRSLWLAAGVALAAALSGITGVISYQHGLFVARLTGSTGLAGYLVPLVPDLMIAMSSVTLIEASRRSRRPATAMLALVAGIGWTVAQNIAGGWHGGTGGRLIAAGIPLALVATFESLLWLLRNRHRPDAEPGENQPQPEGPLTTETALRALVASDSERRLEEVLGIPRSRVQAWKRQLAGADQGPAPAALNGAGAHA